MTLAIRHIVPARRKFPGIHTGLTVIVPAAGIGTRMKLRGSKALLELADGTTIIERQIQIIKLVYPCADIVIVLGFEGDKIFKRLRGKYDVRFVYNEHVDETNVGHSITIGLQNTYHNNILVVYGDLIFDELAIKKITHGPSAVLVDTQNKLGKGEVGVAICDGHVTNFAYGVDDKWGQIAYITGDEYDILCKAAFTKERSKLMGYELLNQVIEGGGVFDAFAPPSFLLVEIDSMKDMEKIPEILLPTG